MAARTRRGFALLAAVIVIAVVAVIATVVTVTISGDNDQDRIERAADVLHRLVAAMDTVNTSSNGSSFGGQVAKYPLQLSQLTHHISTSDRACNNTLYAGADVTKWRGPYYLAPIPTTGYNVAPGFFANNALVKISTTNLAIQMDNVSLADAQDLETVVEKKSTGAGPIVTFALTDPTSVQYHLIFATGKC